MSNHGDWWKCERKRSTRESSASHLRPELLGSHVKCETLHFLLWSCSYPAQRVLQQSVSFWNRQLLQGVYLRFVCIALEYGLTRFTELFNNFPVFCFFFSFSAVVGKKRSKTLWVRWLNEVSPSELAAAAVLCAGRESNTLAVRQVRVLANATRSSQYLPVGYSADWMERSSSVWQQPLLTNRGSINHLLLHLWPSLWIWSNSRRPVVCLEGSVTRLIEWASRCLCLDQVFRYLQKVRSCIDQ